MRSSFPVLILAFTLTFSCTPKYVIDHSKPTRPLELPKDDAAHYTAQTEWWYYTGHLKAEDGAEYGFEVTFFKRLTSEDRTPLLRLPGHYIKEVGMMGHFAITDLVKKKFKASQIINIGRKSKADPDRLHVFINGWSTEAKDGSHHLKASMMGYAVDLKLTPAKPAALHGPGGVVEKGVGSNYYYSYSNITVEGTITDSGKKKTVTGKAWMDHEFGPMSLFKTQVGWDWFSIQFDNDTELMLYLIRSDDRLMEQSGGTFVGADGKTTWLKIKDMEISELSTWTSPKTKAVYPSGWSVIVRPLKLQFTVKPVMAEQELALKPVTYWEGAVMVAGDSGGKPVSGKGYVELVGYDKKASFGNIK